MNDYIKTESAVSSTSNNVSAAVALRTYERDAGDPSDPRGPRGPRARRIAVRERVTNVDGCCTIDYIAGFLGHADLRERMVSDGLIQADGLPYQHYLDCGYLVAVEGDDAGPEVLVTPWGMSWLLNRYPMTEAARYTHMAARAIQ